MIASAGRLAGVSLFAAGLVACGALAGSGSGDVRPIDKSLADEASTAPLPSRAGAPERARVAAVDVSASHACALLVSGKIACWGDNREGQLGVALPRASGSPLLVADVDRATSVQAGSGVSCARRVDRSVVCWGKGGGVVSIPKTEGATELVVSDGGGPFDACAIVADGSVACWDLPEAIPTTMPGLAGTTSLVLGQGIVCGLSGGQARCIEPSSKEWLRE
ncbi:MAG TPA: RCC1 domain-containing protein, partial [Polyangiaceae bacterium]|nr:RCC1 domain-containing protein [Polyangiaceae bacterium]